MLSQNTTIPDKFHRRGMPLELVLVFGIIALLMLVVIIKVFIVIFFYVKTGTPIPRQIPRCTQVIGKYTLSVGRVSKLQNMIA